MALAVEFTNPLSADDMKVVSASYDDSVTLKELLPFKKPMDQFQFEVRTGQPNASSLHTEAFGGLELASSSSEGTHPKWSMTVLRDFVTFQCREYKRWREEKPIALQALLLVIGKVIGPSREIKAIGLQYQDVFDISGDIARFNTVEIARQPNKWLPESAFKHPSFWHVHQGWFSAAPDNRRVLNLLNIDFGGEPPKYKMRINGQHRMLPIDMNGNPLRQNHNELERAFDHMHEVNKRVLIELLNEDMLSLIGLNHESGDN